MSLRQPDHSMDLELDSAATSVPGTLASSQLCVSDAESWSLAPVLCRRGRESCCQTPVTQPSFPHKAFSGVPSVTHLLMKP